MKYQWVIPRLLSMLAGGALGNKHFATNTLDYRCLHIFHLVKGEWQIFTANVYQGNFNSFQLCIFELIIVNLNSG